MTEEAKKRRAEKEARIRAAIELREGDRVPMQIGGNIFAVTEAGYTMAEVIYDETLVKAKNSVIKFLETYDPDFSNGLPELSGEGKTFEMLAPTFFEWPGRSGTKVDDNSIQQFIEFPILLDDEFDMFFTDRTGWKIANSMTKLSPVCKPLENLKIPLSHRGGLQVLADEFSKPEMREMIETFWKVSDKYKEIRKSQREAAAEISELGYPELGGGKAMVPFDEYSDTLRGTMLSLTDLYDNREVVERFIEEYQPTMLEAIKNFNKDGSKTGKLVHMTLHKGLDGFMSDEYYVKFYWRHLQEIIQAIVDVGMIPNVFCEGRYSTRLGHLRDIPKGKVIYKFEDTPMPLAKKMVGDVACITGGFPNTLLELSTADKVTEECKRMLDACAPGGGFIFQTKASLGLSKRENVEAMFKTVREYGKY